MSVWIKICGLTQETGVDAAIEAEVDAVGFVFAPSPRQVPPARARALAGRIPSRIARVAVMLHPSQALLDQVLAEFSPDLMQADLVDFEDLVVPDELGRLPVLRSGSPVPPRPPECVLYEGARSGTGETADWGDASALARRSRLILAGCLSAANVAAALATVRPFGVDVSTGVEVSPGVKSRERILEFAAIARTAGSPRSNGETG